MRQDIRNENAHAINIGKDLVDTVNYINMRKDCLPNVTLFEKASFYVVGYINVR